MSKRDQQKETQCFHKVKMACKFTYYLSNDLFTSAVCKSVCKQKHNFRLFKLFFGGGGRECLHMDRTLFLCTIEHSENKVFTQSGMFENEIEPGVLHSAFDKHEYCKNTKAAKAQTTCNVDSVRIVQKILGDFWFVEYQWTGALQVQSRFCFRNA